MPEATRLEIAVLKGIAAHFVMRAQERLSLMRTQREVVAGLVARLQEAAPDVLEPAFGADFTVAGSDAARLRVVVDQVAALTDASALAWHARLGA